MKEENKSLSEKIFDRKLVLGDDISKIFAKHVKEKVQNVKNRLQAELFMAKNIEIGAVKVIVKIFKEEFGEEL